MRILIELPTWLGDAVMASAAVEAIAKHAATAFGEGNSSDDFEVLADAAEFDEGKFSFSSRDFGEVTQEAQVFASGTRADDAANGGVNLTAKTREGGQNLGDESVNFGSGETPNTRLNFTSDERNLPPSYAAQRAETKTASRETATLNLTTNVERGFENLAQDFETQELQNQTQNFKNSQADERQAAQNRRNLPPQNRAENQTKNAQNLADESVKIVFFGSFAACELFKAHPNCEQAIVDSGKRAKFRLWRLFWLARNLGEFGAAFSFRSSFASKILLFGARSKRKFAFKKSADASHQVQKYLKFVKSALNLGQAADELKLYFKPRKFDAPVLGLNPGASYGSAKRWYPEYFAQAALEFKDKFRIVIFGGGGERDICEEIERILHRDGAACENLAGKTSVRELCENIGGIGASGGVFVTNDSGPMHIAAAYKTPTIALFGPTRFAQTCPWRNENARILRLNLACMPCMKRVCPLKTHACMKRLSPQAVAEAIRREFMEK